MMPDDEPTPEEMEDIVQARIARDDKYALIDLAIKINDSIAQTAAWQYILKRAQIDRDEALAQLSTVPVHDQNAIRRLQNRAQIVTILQQWLKEVDEQAKAAHELIKYEDGLVPGDTA